MLNVLELEGGGIGGDGENEKLFIDEFTDTLKIKMAENQLFLFMIYDLVVQSYIISKEGGKGRVSFCFLWLKKIKTYNFYKIDNRLVEVMNNRLNFGI